MKKMVATFGVVLLTSSILLGCGNEAPIKEDTKHEHKHEPSQEMPKSESQGIGLKRWEGRWTSLETAISSPEAMKVAEMEAKDEAVDKNVLIEAQKKRLMSPVTMVEVKGDVIVLYKGKDKLSEASYRYVRSQMAMRGTDETNFDIFMTEDKNSAYPYIALSETHGDEGYAHFHAKFGKAENGLFDDKTNDPTFIDEKTPITVMAEEVFE